MTTIESNRCYICGKLFCCSDCCIVHIKKKHPSRDSECPLCRSEKLLVKNFSNQEFLCHVVFHHLPLHCHLCGIEFKNCEDLQDLEICSRRLIFRRSEEAQKSLPSPETSSSINKTPIGQTGTRKKEFSIDGDYNDNFSDLTSPPEFSRHTSTPMHVNLAGFNANFVFKTPKSPNFSLKTPKTANSQTSRDPRRNEHSCSNKENNSSSSNDTNFKDIESSCTESNYLSFSRSITTINDRTPLRSILSNRSTVMSDSSSYLAKSRKIGVMQKLDEEMGFEALIDMELTNPQVTIESGEFSPITENQESQQKDSGKKVRFSDQFEMKNESEPGSPNIDATEEEFFEARQSLSEISIATMEKLSVSSALINKENQENFEKEENDAVIIKSPESSEPKRQNDASNSSSSRVIMMVVVEKNGSVNAADLAPLIDSSLKKLEVMGLSSSENTNDSLPRGNENSIPATSVLTVDSYTSVSTIECYTPQESPIIDTFQSPQSPRESTSGTSPVSGGGIFSAMANAMRVAFRNLSGTNSSRNLSREPLARDNLSSSESNTASANGLTSFASALVPRTSKRSRDNEEISSQPLADVVDPLIDVRSPVSKRPRGWYQIRAREPIARMRNNNHVTSTKGVSSENQRFQQGSLSVGDTILPIPSRAHQYTQTD